MHYALELNAFYRYHHIGFSNMSSRPEIFIGIVGAVGANLSKVSEALQAELHSVGYHPNSVKLSDLMSSSELCPEFSSSSGVKEDTRINSAMDAGDSLRSRTKRADALALLAIYPIWTHRR